MLREDTEKERENRGGREEVQAKNVTQKLKLKKIQVFACCQKPRGSKEAGNRVMMDPRRIRSTEEKQKTQPRRSRGSGRARDSGKGGGKAKNKVEAHAKKKRKKRKRKSEYES